MSAMFVNDDTRDVARLQADLMQKASPRKFNPAPLADALNFAAVDVSELQLGMVDNCDCLLAAGGKTMAKQYCDPVYLRDPVVGFFEDLAQDQLTDPQKDWLSRVQRLAEGAPHPRTYIHGAIFLFRNPKERAALSYAVLDGIRPSRQRPMTPQRNERLRSPRLCENASLFRFRESSHPCPHENNRIQRVLRGRFSRDRCGTRFHTASAQSGHAPRTKAPPKRGPLRLGLDYFLRARRARGNGSAPVTSRRSRNSRVATLMGILGGLPKFAAIRRNCWNGVLRRR